MRYFMIVYNDITDHISIDEVHPIAASLHSINHDIAEVGAVRIDENYSHGGRDWTCLMDGKNAVEALKRFMEVVRLD